MSSSNILTAHSQNLFNTDALQKGYHDGIEIEKGAVLNEEYLKANYFEEKEKDSSYLDDKKQIQYIRINQKDILPSCFYKKGQIEVVGQPAKQRGAIDPKNFI